MIRLVLPYILLHLLNDRLANIPGYTGHAEDLNLALIRGAYQIEGIHLDKVDSISADTTRFIAAELIDLSVEWKALFHGSIVGELEVDRPDVFFVKDAVEPAEVQADTADLGALLEDLMPLKINRVQLRNGKLHYLDPGSTPKVDIQMTAIDALARNLRNSYDSTEVLPAALDITARVYGGTFALNMRLNPLSKDPTLDMNAELKDVRLVELNEFLQAYGNVDVNKGTFGLYTEIATRQRQFDGYVKPVINDLDVLGPEDRKDTFFRKLWEGLVGTAGAILTNPKEDQVATKVRFSGKLDGPRTNTFYAVVDLLRNAFIRALQPAIDREVNINSVAAPEKEKEGFFKRLFDKDQ
ncbi:MAG: DUF748 domain-containing protein [Flavobacteriales bacterium]|nr:DUF748 domain-containing protein [Flavobacteriales bacterium]